MRTIFVTSWFLKSHDSSISLVVSGLGWFARDTTTFGSRHFTAIGHVVKFNIRRLVGLTTCTAPTGRFLGCNEHGCHFTMCVGTQPITHHVAVWNTPTGDGFPKCTALFEFQRRSIGKVLERGSIHGSTTSGIASHRNDLGLCNTGFNWFALGVDRLLKDETS